MSGSRIIGLGSYLPRKVVKNADLPVPLAPYSEQLQEFFNGVEERRHCEADETNVMIGVEAAKKALARAKISAMDVDLIISYSMFTDYVTPRDVNFIAKELEAFNATCWHLDTACSSFIPIMKIADAMLKNGNHRRALLVFPTNQVNRGFEGERDHRCLGDGASAVVVERAAENHVLAEAEITDSIHADKIQMLSPIVSGKPEYVVFMRNAEAKNYYKRGMQLVRDMMTKARIFPNDIDWLICHQPGMKMIDLYCKDLEIDRAKNLNSCARTGHLSAANLPYLMDYYVNDEPRIKRGDKILFYSPGAGTHFGAMIYQY